MVIGKEPGAGGTVKDFLTAANRSMYSRKRIDKMNWPKVSNKKQTINKVEKKVEFDSYIIPKNEIDINNFRLFIL